MKIKKWKLKLETKMKIWKKKMKKLKKWKIWKKNKKIWEKNEKFERKWKFVIKKEFDEKCEIPIHNTAKNNSSNNFN